LKHIEIPAAFEDAHIREFQFRAAATEALVLEADVGVWVFRLRVFVERLGVGVSGGGIEVVVALLHVLAVVALVSAEAEQALLEDAVVAVPEGGGEAKAAAAVAPALQAVLTPAVGATAGLVVREGGPERCRETRVAEGGISF
jgi:hypothetical protein